MSQNDAGDAPTTVPHRVWRRGWRTAVVASVLSLVGSLVWSGTSRNGTNAEPGPSLGYVSLEPRQAPGFRVHRIGGGTVDIADPLRSGTPVVLNMWASWCVPCREEMPAIERAARLHPDVRFIGIAVQDIEAAAESFAMETGVTFDLGIDDGSVIGAYPTLGLPTTWFIDGDGVIFGQRFGEMDDAELTDRVEKMLGG